MRKIAFVIPQLYGGGAERVTAVLANELCRDPKNEVHILTYRRSAADYPTDPRICRHVPVQSLDGSARTLGAKFAFLRQTLRQLSPDCVVSLAGPSQLALLTLILPGMGIPWIVSERNDPGSYPKSRIFRLTRLLTYRLCDAVVFQTGDARDYFPAAIRKKGTVICNPITGSLPERFTGVRDKRIVNWCRLNSQKNLALLLDAFGGIAGAFPEYTLHIYGDGPEREKLSRKAKEMGLEERIFLHGYTNTVYEQVRTASLFVSSSDYEGMSNSMLEAIALGIPAVCTDCPIGGAREIIKDGVNGLLVPVGDRAALERAMAKVLSDEALAATLSHNGCRLRGAISSEAVAGRWMALIDEVLRKRRRNK